MTLTQKWTRSNSIVIPHVAPRQGSKPLNTNQRQSKDQIISEYPYIYLRPTLNSSSRILTFTFTKTSSKIYQSQFPQKQHPKISPTYNTVHHKPPTSSRPDD